MAIAHVTVPSPAEERVDWIDEQGRLLGVVGRAEMRRRNLLHPVTATFVFRPDGRLFVQQRAADKDVYPGLLDLSVGGTVTHGEGYLENAQREVAEELGVTGAPLYRLFRHRFRDGTTHSLIEVFACIHDGPIRLQPEEVAGGEWMSLAEVRELVATPRVCPDSRQGWRLFERQCADEGDLHERIASGQLQPAIQEVP